MVRSAAVVAARAEFVGDDMVLLNYVQEGYRV